MEIQEIYFPFLNFFLLLRTRSKNDREIEKQTLRQKIDHFDTFKDERMSACKADVDLKNFSTMSPEWQMI